MASNPPPQENMDTDTTAEEFIRLWTKAQEEMHTSSIHIPTQAQLRALANSLNRDNLLDLGLLQEEEADAGVDLDANEIFQRMQQHGKVASEIRDEIWDLASAMDIDLDDGEELEEEEEEEARRSMEIFTCFPFLPLELRTKIWKHAVESDRVVEVIWQARRSRWWAVGTSTARSRVPYPAVFVTCKEARDCTRVIRERMVMAFGTWIDLGSDLIWVNSLQTGVLGRRFMAFVMGVYEAVVGVGVDDFVPVGDEEGEWEAEERARHSALEKLPRLAITWEMWEEMLDRTSEEEDDDLSVGGEFGLLRSNLKSLKELLLINVVHARDQRGKLYRDGRVLTESELLDIESSEKLPNPAAALEKARQNLKFEERECVVRMKMLQRGNDGLGGARSEFLSQDPSFIGIATSLIAMEQGSI